jgi:low affinity Fe/Cu permease
VAQREQKPFGRLARAVTYATGSWWAALGVAVGVLVWIVVGKLVGFRKGWELSATAGVPLLTLLLLIVIQHTQNHNDRAIQLKLDEIIRAVGGASNSMITVDEGDWDELDDLSSRYRGQADADRRRSDRGARDRGDDGPDVALGRGDQERHDMGEHPR